MVTTVVFDAYVSVLKEMRAKLLLTIKVCANNSEGIFAAVLSKTSREMLRFFDGKLRQIRYRYG